MKVDGITLLQLIRNWKIKEGTKIKIINEFSDYRNNEKLIVYPDRLEHENGEMVGTDLILGKFYMFEIETTEKDKPIEELPEPLNKLVYFDKYDVVNMINKVIQNQNAILNYLKTVNELKKESDK